MSLSHPRPPMAWAQQTIALVLATCVTLLAVSAGAAARTSGPIATISATALHRAIALRKADRRTVAHDSTMLRACRRPRTGRCAFQRRAARRSRVRLAAAERLLRRLSAHTARKHHRPKGAHPNRASGGSGSGRAAGGTGAGRATGMTSGSGTSGSGSGTKPGAGSTGSSSGDFGQPFVKGVNTNLQGWGPAAEPQIAHEITTVGAHWAREDLNWSKVEPQRGVFDWSSFDQMVTVAKANDITILPVAGYAPSWSTPGSSADYAAFVAAAVARYGPGTAANLQTWELWNEPYYAYAWSGKPGDPAAYARDVVAASQAAKRVAPTVEVLMAAEDGDAAAGGGLWWTTSVDAYFAAVPDLGKWIDGVAVHPYGNDPSQPVKEADGFRATSGGWSFQRIDSIRSDFAAHGVNVPFWITEIGWTTSEVSEATQAHNYEDLTAQIAARPWVRAMFSYCLREFNGNPADSEAQFGLEKYGTWQPKQAFYALQKGFATLS